MGREYSAGLIDQVYARVCYTDLRKQILSRASRIQSPVEMMITLPMIKNFTERRDVRKVLTSISNDLGIELGGVRIVFTKSASIGAIINARSDHRDLDNKTKVGYKKLVNRSTSSDNSKPDTSTAN